MTTITKNEIDCEFWSDAAFCGGPSNQGAVQTDPGPTPTGNEEWEDIPLVLYPVIDGNIISADGVILSECEIYNECDDDFVSNCPEGLNYLSGWCLNGSIESTEVLSTEQAYQPKPNTLPETGIDSVGLVIVALMAVVMGAMVVRMERFRP